MTLPVPREEPRPLPSDQSSDADEAMPQYPRGVLMRRIFQAAAILLAVASIGSSLTIPEASFFSTFLTPSTAMVIAVALVFVAFLESAGTLVVSTVLFLSYLGYHQVPSLLGSSLCYLALFGIGSYLWASRLQMGAWGSFGGSSLVFRYFLAGLILTLATCSMSVLALALGQHRPGFLVAGSILWAVFALVVAIASGSASAQSPLVTERDPAELPTRSLVDSFRALTIILVLLAVIAQLHVGWNTGDANKSYLAFAKYYSWSNSIVLDEPAWERDQNHAFPHLQEMLLATGFTLDGRLGAKAFAVLIILLKLQAIFWVSRRSFGLSRARSWLLLFSYVSVPIVMDMNMVVRPENLLTLFTLYAFYFFEEACRFLRGGSTHAEDEKRSQSILRATMLAGSMVLCACSVKYTGLYLGVVYLLIYWRPLLHTLMRLPRVKLPLVVLALSSFSLFSFWFLRNYFMFDRWVSSSPHGKYHLTVVFPGVRSFSDLRQFLVDGFVALRSGHYTEFPDFGYGVWGFFLVPVVLWSLSERGAQRRAGIASLLVMAMMLYSTKQIRYYANIAPLLFCLFFANSIASRFAAYCSALATHSPQRLRVFAFLALLVPVVVFVAVIPQKPSVVQHVLEQRLAPVTRSISEQREPWATINKQLQPSDGVMGGLIDLYYDIDARVYQTRGFLFGPFYDEITQHGVTHLLQYPYLRNSIDSFFFNDRRFLEVVGEQIEAAPLSENDRLFTYLYRIKFPVLERIRQYVIDRDWDIDQTLIVSEERLQSNPLMIHAAEKLDLPDLATPLYRAAGFWSISRGVPHYNRLIEDDPKAYFHPSGWMFEKPGTPHTVSGSLVVEKRVSNLVQDVRVSNVPMFRPKKERPSGELLYSFRIPEGANATASKVSVYLRGRSATAEDTIKVLVRAGGMTSYAAHPQLDKRGRWFLAGQAYLSPTEQQFEVAIRLKSKVKAEQIFVENIGVVVSKPSAEIDSERYSELGRRDVVLHSDIATLKAALAPNTKVSLEEGTTGWLIDDFAGMQIRSSSQLRNFRSFSAIGIQPQAQRLQLVLPNKDGVLRYKFPTPHSMIGAPARLEVYLKGYVDTPTDALTLKLEHLGEQETISIPTGAYSANKPIAVFDMSRLSEEETIRATFVAKGGRHHNSTQIGTLIYVLNPQ